MENNTNYQFKLWNGSPNYTGEQHSSLGLDYETPLYCRVTGGKFLRLVGLTKMYHGTFNVCKFNGKLIYTTEPQYKDFPYYVIDLTKTGHEFMLTAEMNFGTEKFLFKHAEIFGEYSFKKAVSLKVVNPPDRTMYYDRQNFSTTGMQVEATFDDGSKEILDNSKLYVPDKFLRINQNSVTIKYENCSVTQRILVTHGFNGIKPSYVIMGADAVYNDENAYKNFALSDGVSFDFDMLRKCLSYTIPDVSGENTLLSLSLSHVYRPSRANFGYGKGFSLNLCERIIYDSQELGLYYIDGRGDWYQLENDLHPERNKAYKNFEYTQKEPAAFNNLFMYRHYKQLKEEGVNVDDKLAVEWLTDNNFIKGFNTFGYLVMICDTCGNYYEIEYKDDKIVAIHDQRFNYAVNTYILTYDAAGNLKKLTDNKKTVEFVYADGFVKTIKYSDGRALTLEYDGDILTAIKSSEGFSNTVKVSGGKLEISVRSTLDGVPDGEMAEGQLPVSFWEIDTSANKVTVRDNERNEEQYSTDGVKYVSEYIAVQNGFVTSAEKYEYTPRESKTVTKAKRSSLYKDLSEFVFADGEINKTVLNKFSQPISETTRNMPVSDGVYADVTKTYSYNAERRLTKDVTTVTYKFATPKTYVLNNTYEYNEYGLPQKKTSWVTGEEATEGKTVEEYVYDNYGRQTESKVHNTLDGKIFSSGEKVYDIFGRVITEFKPAETVRPKYEYEYDGTTDRLSSVTAPNGCVINYTYDLQDRLIKITATDGEENGNEILYDSGEITQLKSKTNTINYTYDGSRRVSGISVDGVLHQSYVYDTHGADGKVKSLASITVTNAKNESFKAEENFQTDTTTAYLNGGKQLEAVYRADGNVSKINDCLTGEVSTFTYDGSGRLTNYLTVKDNSPKYAESITYDGYGEVTKIFQNDDFSGLMRATRGMTYDYTYADGYAHRLKSISISGVGTISPDYDKTDRHKGRQVNSASGRRLLTEAIKYEDGDIYAKTQPYEIEYTFAGGSKEKISYSYDKTGNITEIIYPDGKGVNYKYDKLNRLIREDNKALYKTYLYSYDANGNMLRKEEAIYTKPDYPITAPNTLKTEYKYENGKLKQVGEEACMYDAVGNPLQHRMRMGWTGRKLTSCMGRRINVIFEYDGRGRRIRKGMTEYKYDSQDRLISSSDGMKYFYDEVGVAGFIYDGATYYYVRDVQKNVIAILDSSGVKVVEYSYDAWGNQQVSGSNTTLGNLNPFRYRSYFYDTETELYYLNTRYYDPIYCRFINMDSFDYADPEQLNGLNLYAYCANNPVMGYDPDGTFVISIGIVTALGILAAGSALLAWIEHTFHPIQNALNDLGDAIGDLFNDLSSNISGGDNFTYTEFNGIEAINGIRAEEFLANLALTFEVSNILLYAEHTKETPCLKDKHQKGQRRKGKDKSGGEKGDRNRPYRRGGKHTKRHFISFCLGLFNIIF